MKKKLVLQIVLGIFLIIVVFAGFMVYKIVATPVPTIEIGTVDLTKVVDGFYSGQYDGGMVVAAVKVEVRDHKIVSIEITKHDNGMGKKAEAITSDIIDKQSINVDVVSGATHSSKVILKAVQNALEQGTK